MKRIIILIFAIIIGGGFWWWQTQSANNWQIYRNEELGIEINYPKYVDANYSANRCHTSEINDVIPLKVFADDNFLYIGASSYYVKDPDKSCRKVKETLAGIKKEEGTGLKINIIDNIKNDNDLEQFLKDRYGLRCNLGEKKKINDYTYAVSIIDNSENLNKAQCSPPFSYGSRSVLYSPTQQKIATLDIGIDCSFAFDKDRDGLDLAPPSKDCIDSKIEIKFIK